MKVVSDTNIFLAVVLNEPERERIVRITAGRDVVAPEILPYEIGNALSAMLKRRQLDADKAMAAWESVGRIPVRLLTTNIREALGLAARFNIYAYDAYFLQCAMALSCPLLTLDRRMGAVAAELGIALLE